MQATAQQSDPIRQALEQQAAQAFNARTLPAGATAWQQQRKTLYGQIMRQTGAVTHHDLPTDFRETRRIPMQGFSIRTGYFQTRPGVYATISLYVPEGKGPFPAVVVTHGHWQGGRNGEIFQSVAQQLALHGYVALNIDAWGTGERTTVHGEHEYHGSCLGASLLNTGASLMGMQITDNIRAVDLLGTLPYVDAKRIGVTGASGGGNQAMWLAALDERIKAAIPVVSVGTFESYIMNGNCICELLPGGLTFTEEAGVLAMVAPRGLKLFNAIKDNNRAFTPAQMQRSFAGAQRIYELLKVPHQLSYQLFDTTHGYWPDMQEAMLGWFDQQLKGKGNGAPVKINPPSLLPPEQLMAFPAGRRDTLVQTTAAWCRQTDNATKAAFKPTGREKETLRSILMLQATPVIKSATRTGSANGWDSILIITSTNEQLPLLYRAPRNGSGNHLIITNGPAPEQGNEGIVLLDLWGTGARNSPSATTIDGKLPAFHTLYRSLLWLGETVMGKWVNELQLAHSWLQQQKAGSISIQATREAGLAALFHAAIYNNVVAVTLHNSPLSYRFDERSGVDYFTMAAPLPGILPWGDVSMAAALSNANVTFAAPVSISGRPIAGNELVQYRQEFEKLKKKGTVQFREK